MNRWLTPSWWSYLLDGCGSLRQFICRARGHPEGMVWYNTGGPEPDTRCNNCNEDLG